MQQATLSPLTAWVNFYVIMGSSAGALIGLQFVVIVLGAQVNALADASVTRAFGTPTIIHLCSVLLISAIVNAPWPALSGAGLALGVCGVAGVVYAAMVIRHARRQTDYEPVAEDWIWHCVLPVIAYGVLLVAAVLLGRFTRSALFVIGGTALLLLFTAIHNAWDAVTYIALERRHRPKPMRDER